MPTYDLFCPDCGHEREYLSKVMTSDIDIECDSCGKAKYKKKMGLVGTVFKGPGFYATEYGRAKYNNYKKDKKELAERDEFIENAKQKVGE